MNLLLVLEAPADMLVFCVDDLVIFWLFGNRDRLALISFFWWGR
jgi:hypothetical protein